MVDKRLKYILYILMIISLFFTIKNKVHAQTYVVQDKFTNSTNNADLGKQIANPNTSTEFTSGKQLFNNQGMGYVNFVAYFDNQASGTNTIDAINVFTPNKQFGCTFNLSMYKDNTTQTAVTAVQCPVDLSNTYIQGVYFHRTDKWGTTQIYLGNYWTFTSDKDSSNAIFDTMNANLNILGQEIRNNGARLDTIITKLNALSTSSTNITTAINNQSTQQHQDSQNTQNKIDNIDNTIKDSSTDNQKAQQTFDSLNSNMATNSTISDLLLMPIHLLQKILNGLQGSCSAINLGELFGSEFILPCINPSDVIGTSLWGIIDVICSGFLAYHIGKRFVVIFNQFTNLKEGGLESAYD